MSVSDSNHVTSVVAVARKTKQKINRFRKVQNYQPELGDFTCFISTDNRPLIFFGLN